MDEGARQLQGAPAIRKGENSLFPFLASTNDIIPSTVPVAQPSAVTCQSDPDRRWPCSPLMIPVDLVFARWFWGRLLCQLAHERGATPNKITPTASDTLIY